MLTLAMIFSLVTERELQRFKQSAAFFVGFSSSCDSHIHTTDFVYFVVVNFWEDDLLFHTHAVVTTAIKRFAIDTTEVTDRKSTRLNSSHVRISYAVYCMKKKNI